MAIFSQRKVQRLKQMLMQKAADSELDEVCDFLNQRPKKTQANCGLLKLPAELRNIIYEYVAEDAHAACQKPVDPDLLQGERWREAVLLCGRARQSRDFSGEKVCPGLLGVCHELFREFHSVFYSPRFIDARYHEAGTGWKHIKNPALLDAVVNQKHPVTVFDTIRVQFGIEDVLRQKQQIESMSSRHVFIGMLYLKDSQNLACSIKFYISIARPPWADLPSPAAG
ncbi:hypothetical protein DOTSEDRAFT_69985 [Dothistroma septosporum NZE10]|uniref:F-box domain-containing protein n=1 Tax=Dothistroma septosporum (strain NZE10 / CBS 128990) TaxID=675120 RepID=N1Q0R9_DOTSN|nr:hypothetical protein DOTSEDRAFT_69985 [Dothistroma septosporum NZE10]